MGTRLTATALEAVVNGILQCYGYLPPKEKQKLQARLKKRTAHKKAADGCGRPVSSNKGKNNYTIILDG